MTRSEPVEPGDALERVAAACHHPLTGIWEELDERMAATVLAAVTDVRARHVELMVECGLGSGAPGDPIARRASLITYRHGLTADVLPALVAALEHHKPTTLVAKIFANRFTAAVDQSRGLPVAEPVFWASGALDAKPDDSLRRRAGKRLARWISVARKPERHRPLPFRALALRHLERHVLPLYDRAASDSVRSWAQWAGRLERACATWSETALPTLMEADVAVVLDPDPETSSGGGDVEDAAWAALRQAAEALGEALDALAAGNPDTELRSRTEGLMEQLQVALDSDLRAAGSFVFQPEIPIIGAHPLSELDRTRATLSGWDEQIATRMALYRSLLALTVGGAAVRERLGRRMDEVAVKPLEVLGPCLDELDRLSAEARRTGPGDSDVDQFEDLRARGNDVVARALDAFPDRELVSTELESIVGDTVDALQGIVRQTPERLVVHRLDSRTPTTMRVAETRQISFQEFVRQSLDAVRIERIRAATLGLGSALAPIEASVDELPGVIQFAFDACRDELEAEPPEDATSRAALLAAEALERAMGVLGQTPDRVRAAVAGVDQRVASELAQGGLSLLDRVDAGRVQSQFLRAQSRFGDALLHFEARFRPAVDRLRRRARLVRIKTARFGSRASRRTMALLGKDGGAPAAQSARTVRAFARGDSGPGHVPIVYQRLFSLAPVTDAAFLTGRAVELADVQQRWRRWGEEDEVPVIVRGYPGIGVTSFIRVIVDTLGDDGATVVRHEVEDRIRSEADLVALLAELLELEPTETLGEFARTILRIPKGHRLPDVVALDGLEHLYLRVPAGTDVLERFLTFMSETEPRIFWLGGVSQPAWNLIAKAEPTAVSQVEDFELRALSVERLKESILQRHRRSGLRLRFAEPREGRAFLKRRLRRLRGTDAHQRLLEDDFFAQLHRVSLGNLKLALFHWMLAADFEQSEGEVVMQPLRKPDFGVLDALDPMHNFTLKALLEHRTLTLEEHHSVFRVSRQESYQIFESLQNRRLIERMDAIVASEADDSEINATSSYRIRPLLVGAVTGHLRTLNIVH